MKILSAVFVSSVLILLGTYLDRRLGLTAVGLSTLFSIAVTAWKLHQKPEERIVYRSRPPEWSDPGWAARWK